MKKIIRIQQSLVRGSGKSYCDTSIILVAFIPAPPPCPPQKINNDRSPLFVNIRPRNNSQLDCGLWWWIPPKLSKPLSPIYSLGYQSPIYSLSSVWSCIYVYVYLYVIPFLFIPMYHNYKLAKQKIKTSFNWLPAEQLNGYFKIRHLTITQSNVLEHRWQLFNFFFFFFIVASSLYAGPFR